MSRFLCHCIRDKRKISKTCTNFTILTQMQINMLIKHEQEFLQQQKDKIKFINMQQDDCGN